MSSGAPPNYSMPEEAGAPIPYFDDPCATFKKLMAAYQEVIMGGGIAKTEYHGNGQERHVEFSTPNVSRLKELMDAAYDECMKNAGAQPRVRRFAIRGGSLLGR